MNKHLKRFGAMILTGAMLCSMAVSTSAVTYVAKIGTTGYTTLSNALDNVQNGQTIVLQTNITNEASGVSMFYQSSEDKSFTIDFNGKKITETRASTSDEGVYDGMFISVAANAGSLSITLKNGSIIASGNNTDAIYVQDLKAQTPTDITLSNMTISASDEAGINCFGVNLDVQSANITGLNEAIYAEDCTINLKAGQFVANGTENLDGAIAVYNSNTGLLNMNAVTTPEAPAIIRPSDWKTNQSQSISIINFTDVTPSWYYDYVYEAAAKGIVSGADNVWTFKPNDNVTREQFAAILANAAGADLTPYQGISNFSDVKADTWSAPAIEWARANGIVSGRGNGTFAPTANITRQEVCVMLNSYQAKMMNLEPIDRVEATYPDSDDVASWAQEAVQNMLMQGIMAGAQETQSSPVMILPLGTATRAQSCVLVTKLLALDSAI